MDNNNEVFSESDAEVLSEISNNIEQHTIISAPASSTNITSSEAVLEEANVEPTANVEKPAEFDEVLLDLNNRSKKLETCITARHTFNKVKEKTLDYRKRIEAQEQRIKELKSIYASIITTEANNDEFSEYKNNIKQNCATIGEYVKKMSQEVDSNPDSLSTLVNEVKHELTIIEAKSKIVTALQEKNNLFQAHADMQKHCIAAENRFQIAFADYNDNRLF